MHSKTRPITAPTGSRFWAADFHVHTPGSRDFRERGATPEDLLKAAEDARIQLLAVTDHNTSDWVDRMRVASKNTGVIVFPGVEITTPEGHILGIFERDSPSEAIFDLLLRIGIPRNEHGREEAISREHAEKVIHEIHAAGGVAIAAHANGHSGLLKTKGQYKLKVVPSPELGALELDKQDEITRFCTGTVSADYQAKACTQSSDSHALSEMGRRVTYLKMDQVSLRGVRQALLDHEVKVRFPWNRQGAAHPAILGLKVDQGFFEGEAFVFQDGLNCLVGGKGTGKSTVIELLRYCFDDPSGFDGIRDDHEGKIATLVGTGGTISVSFRDTDGETKTIRREVAMDPANRDVRDSAGSPAAIESPPAFFSQGELVQIAGAQIAQLELIDRHLDLASENDAEREAVDALQANAVKLVACQNRLSQVKSEIDDPETGKAASEAQYAKWEAQLKSPVLKDMPAWEAEQTYLRDLAGALDEVEQSFADAVGAIEFDGVAISPPENAPNKIRLRALGKIGESVSAAAGDAEKAFRARVLEIRVKVKEVRTAIAPLYAAKKAEHKQVLDALGHADVRKATAQHQTLGKRLEGLRRSEIEVGRLTKTETTLLDARAGLLRSLSASRKARWTKRLAKVKELEGKLSGVVRVGLVEGGERREYAKLVRELSRNGRLKDPDIALIAGSIAPSVLLQRIRSDGVDPIASEAKVTKEVARRLISACSEKDPKDLYGLDVVPLPDQPEIRYIVAPGREKPLRELSTGQKGTVIIALAMADGAGPLVIDQPEEPLDTQSIYGQVVKTLRSTKGERQFLFTTHNANIAVGADADLSHILDAGADKGQIVSSGGVDHPSTNRLLLLHLEGGRDALNLRARKYED